MTDTHEDIVIAAIRRIGRPARVAEITADAEAHGLRTADTGGVSHRVRTVLQRLRKLGVAQSLGYGVWGLTGLPHTPRRAA